MTVSRRIILLKWNFNKNMAKKTHPKIKMTAEITFVFFISLLLLGGTPLFARADILTFDETGAGETQDTPQTSQDYLKELYNFLLGFVGVAAMGSIVYGGVLYIISAGNPSRVGEAKTAIWNGIIGLLVAAFGYLILTTINPALVGGFDLQKIVETNLNNAQQGQ